MKLAVLLSIFFFLNFAFAQNLNDLNGHYSVIEYTWCNAPHFQETPGSCSFSGWNGVDLDQISEIILEFSETKQAVSITDIDENNWIYDLKKCTNAPHEFEGCKAKIAESSPGKTDITISQWGPGFSRRLTIAFEENKVSVYTPDNAYIVYTIEKN